MLTLHVLNRLRALFLKRHVQMCEEQSGIWDSHHDKDPRESVTWLLT